MSMTRLLAALSAALAITAITASAQVPGHVGRYESSQNDTELILQVTRDFQASLLSKDTTRLSALLLHSGILFSSPASPAGVRKRRAAGDAGFNGVDPAGAQAFLEFVGNSAETIEEKFYNIRITQDAHLAWVMFDFDFVQAGKVENHGLEVWQLLKTGDGTWKILSVVWSSHGRPR